MPIDRKATLLGFSVVSFLAGLYFCLTFDKKEAFTKANAKTSDTGCPDLLVRRGASLLLYNTKTPDADPIPFYNLDEYINYLDIQRKKGVICPILFLQYETTTQGTEVYRMRPSPFDLQAGIPETAASSITQLGGKPV